MSYSDAFKGVVNWVINLAVQKAKFLTIKTTKDWCKVTHPLI